MLNLVFVHLGSNEHGNLLMSKVAEELLNDPRFADKENLVVHVHEHGGWSLGYAKINSEVRCCSSANGDAIFAPEIKAFRDKVRTMSTEVLADIRRP